MYIHPTPNSTCNPSNSRTCEHLITIGVKEGQPDPAHCGDGFWSSDPSQIWVRFWLECNMWALHAYPCHEKLEKSFIFHFSMEKSSVRTRWKKFGPCQFFYLAPWSAGSLVQRKNGRTKKWTNHKSCQAIRSVKVVVERLLSAIVGHMFIALAFIKLRFLSLCSKKVSIFKRRSYESLAFFSHSTQRQKSNLLLKNLQYRCQDLLIFHDS